MKQRTTIRCPDEGAMQSLGADIVSTLAHKPSQGSQLITLSGELGAGKSVLARAMIHAAGYTGRVKSPTYTLIESYDIEKPSGSVGRIAHLDLYRLADPDELHYLGFDDVMDTHDLVLIEWPEKASELLPEACLQISIGYVLPTGRQLTIVGENALAIAQ